VQEDTHILTLSWIYRQTLWKV